MKITKNCHIFQEPRLFSCHFNIELLGDSNEVHLTSNKVYFFIMAAAVETLCFFIVAAAVETSSFFIVSAAVKTSHFFIGAAAVDTSSFFRCASFCGSIRPFILSAAVDTSSFLLYQLLWKHSAFSLGQLQWTHPAYHCFNYCGNILLFHWGSCR